MAAGFEREHSSLFHRHLGQKGAIMGALIDVLVIVVIVVVIFALLRRL